MKRSIKRKENSNLRRESKSNESLKSMISVCSINSLESIEIEEKKVAKHRRKRDEYNLPKLGSTPTTSGLMEILEKIEIGLPID